MPFDFKKAYKELYMPKNKPVILTVPEAHYAVVRGSGNPNLENSLFKQSIAILYAVGRTLKMSYRTEHQIDGFVPYVMPPMEGFWCQADGGRMDLSCKRNMRWTMAIRLPDFITRADFDWAVQITTEKRDMDCAYAKFLTVEEGLCVQCLHIGPYEEEMRTVGLMEQFLRANGYALDLSEERQHHEIYLSDVRKIPPERLRTLLRQPIRRGSTAELYEQVSARERRI